MAWHMDGAKAAEPVLDDRPGSCSPLRSPFRGAQACRTSHQFDVSCTHLQVVVSQHDCIVRAGLQSVHEERKCSRIVLQARGYGRQDCSLLSNQRTSTSLAGSLVL